MVGDQQHLHDPEKAAEFAHALGLMVGGHHPFVGDWRVKGLYAYPLFAFSNTNLRLSVQVV